MVHCSPKLYTPAAVIFKENWSSGTTPHEIRTRSLLHAGAKPEKPKAVTTVSSKNNRGETLLLKWLIFQNWKKSFGFLC